MTTQRWVAPILVALSVVALLVSVAQGIKNSDYERCQARTNDALIRAQQARAAIAEQDRAADTVATDAEDNLWKAVNANQKLPPAEAKSKSEEAFHVFLAERGRAEQMRKDAAEDRARHPLPPPPSERCN